MASDHPATTLTADEALARLRDGNARFLAGTARFPTVQKEILASLARGQQPYATILGCSDSRVPPELVFDAGFGELFVIRVAGNVLGPSIAGTLQYAGTHLHTPLFVVMGHEGCGAVQAAVASRLHGAVHRSRIEALLRAAGEANVRATGRAIRESPEGSARLAEGWMRLVGAVYEIETGRVRFLDG
jgi:carbonic anhydrase